MKREFSFRALFLALLSLFFVSKTVFAKTDSQQDQYADLDDGGFSSSDFSMAVSQPYFGDQPSSSDGSYSSSGVDWELSMATAESSTTPSPDQDYSSFSYTSVDVEASAVRLDAQDSERRFSDEDYSLLELQSAEQGLADSSGTGQIFMAGGYENDPLAQEALADSQYYYYEEEEEDEEVAPDEQAQGLGAVDFGAGEFAGMAVGGAALLGLFGAGGGISLSSKKAFPEADPKDKNHFSEAGANQFMRAEARRRPLNRGKPLKNRR